MENESKLSKILVIIMILGIAALGAVLYFAIQDSRERQELAEQAKIDAQVDVNRIDDSTYHFNLGDGGSCFTLGLANDTLTVDMVNVMLCHIDNDTITVITMRNKAKHGYQFNYSHYFKGSVPEKSKVKFIHN
jgi:hypothetical protein